MREMVIVKWRQQRAGIGGEEQEGRELVIKFWNSGVTVL